MKVQCLTQQQNTMSLARVQAWTTRSGVEPSNCEATEPPTLWMHIFCASQDTNSSARFFFFLRGGGGELFFSPSSYSLNGCKHDLSTDGNPANLHVQNDYLETTICKQNDYLEKTGFHAD